MSKTRKREAPFARQIEVLRLINALSPERREAMLTLAQAYAQRTAATTEDERQGAERRVAEAEAVVNGLIARGGQMTEVATCAG